MLHDFLRGLTTEEMSLVCAIVATLGVFLGSIITGISTLLVPWLLRRSERKRELRQLAVTAGLETWRKSCDIQIEAAKLGEGPQIIGPADPFIGHLLRVLDIAVDMKLSPTEAARRIDALPLAQAKPCATNPKSEQAMGGNADERA